YRAVAALVGWVAEPGIWHQLDGEYAARGADFGSLPADRFLNAIYYEMLQRLIIHDGQSEDAARAKLDADLGVDAWGLPGRAHREMKPPAEPGAPWWWQGAEDASQSFL